MSDNPEAFAFPLDIRYPEPVEAAVQRNIDRLAEEIGLPRTGPEMQRAEDQLREQLTREFAFDNGYYAPFVVLRYTDEEMVGGRARKDALIERAWRLAATLKDIRRVLPDGVAEALRKGRFTVSDIEAVVVYEARPGRPAGWQGDVLLGRYFKPIPQVVGTATGAPLASREGAEDRALLILSALLSVCKRPGAARDRKKWATDDAWEVAQRRELVVDHMADEIRRQMAEQLPDATLAVLDQTVAANRDHYRAKVDEMKTAGLPGVMHLQPIDSFSSDFDHLQVDVPVGDTLVRFGTAAWALRVPHFLDALEDISRRLDADPDPDENDRRLNVWMTGAIAYLRRHPEYMAFLRGHAEDMARVTSTPRRAGEALH